MKLSEYLIENKITTEQFARKMRVTGSTVSKWRIGARNGGRNPNGLHVAKIAKLTKGDVTHGDWDWGPRHGG